jgi:hypothetical protein
MKIRRSRLLIDICLEDSVACTVFKRTNFKVSTPPLVPAASVTASRGMMWFKTCRGSCGPGQMFGLLAGV